MKLLSTGLKIRPGRLNEMTHKGGYVGPCMCAQSWYCFFLVIYMFRTLISSDDGNFRMQLNVSQGLHSNSWFFSRASINDRTGLPVILSLVVEQNNSTKAILPCLRYPFEQFFLTIFLVDHISHPQLNWISGRKLAKLAWGTWLLHTIVVYELFMRFSE